MLRPSSSSSGSCPAALLPSTFSDYFETAATSCDAGNAGQWCNAGCQAAIRTAAMQFSSSRVAGASESAGACIKEVGSGALACPAGGTSCAWLKANYVEVARCAGQAGVPLPGFGNLPPPQQIQMATGYQTHSGATVHPM